MALNFQHKVLPMTGMGPTFVDIGIVHPASMTHDETTTFVKAAGTSTTEDIEEEEEERVLEREFRHKQARSFFKEVSRGGERTRVLSSSFIFSFFTTFPLSHSGSPAAGTQFVKSFRGPFLTSPLGANFDPQV
jgi:hypothetical protein